MNTTTGIEKKIILRLRLRSGIGCNPSHWLHHSGIVHLTNPLVERSRNQPKPRAETTLPPVPKPQAKT